MTLPVKAPIVCIGAQHTPAVRTGAQYMPVARTSAQLMSDVWAGSTREGKA